ncbi:M56 family metallopeptidase [Desulfofarcimen acetoxidans]|uniref:M56 family metallopeptidase n=1 Tax=Desulfofarcimen acetoxidans TaxID=58138 RepID=UPI00019E4A11|nr:M56 family metallopeptidase [Desulfofarcimen acetoxidans]
MDFSGLPFLLPPVKIADDELSLILKHELIHLKRYDLWYKALFLTATVLHWFNQVVYLMAKSAAVQCEISCDALVLQGADFQQRKQYGETIIGVVRNGAKLRTALSTNFYGGKKGMKTRISSIMDTKRKKAGVAVFCVVLVGIIMSGATLAAAANDGQNMTNYNVNYNGATENLTTDFSQYKEYSLIYDKTTNKLTYQGKLVRYFEDFYPLEEGNQAGIDFFDKDGIVDVHAVRDLAPIKNSDGSINPAGKLVGLEQSSQEDFDARDISRFLPSAAQELSQGTQGSTLPDAYSAAYSSGMTTPDELAKVYSVYEPYGLTYDKKQNRLYYNGKLVREFIDILSSNGEALESGKFKGSMRQFNSPDGKGEVDIKSVRDYTKLNADGQGELTGIEVIK